MKKFLLLFVLIFAIGCGSDSRDEPTTPETPKYNQADAVGKWKVTYWDKGTGTGWQKELNERVIEFKVNSTLYSTDVPTFYNSGYSLTGSYSIDANGIIESTLNQKDMGMKMFLNDKTNAELQFFTVPNSNLIIKYKVVKQ